nr:unnamed protein product [Spirometra erinaceieuropaei]
MATEDEESYVVASTIDSKELSTSEESSVSGDDVFDNGKPMTEWTGDDFPKKKFQKPKGLNRVLQGYADCRRTVFGHKKHDDDIVDESDANEVEVEEEGEKGGKMYRDHVCCDGIAGLCGLIFLLLIDIAYVAYATVCNHLATEDDIRLLWLSVIVWLVILVKVFRRLARLGRRRGGCFSPFDSCERALHKGWKAFLRLCQVPWNACWARANGSEKSIKRKKHLTLKIIAIILMLAFVILCLIFFVILKDLRNLVSLSGMVLLLLISVAISWHPGKINWQPPLVGIFVQLLFAVLTLQTRPGYIAFQFLGDRMAEFLENSFAGSKFVFAEYSCFAFNVLPVVIFFSSFISILFHLGIISILIDKPSVVAKKLMGTTGPETLNAVANIFVSMVTFLSIYNFFNRTLTWLGARACMTQSLTFELVFSYILWPIAYTMGVPQEDCLKVAELIGVKSMLNEFVAFERLGVIMKDSEIFRGLYSNATITYLPNGGFNVTLNNGSIATMPYGVLHTNRAEVIVTYALCGFANIGSIGIMLGAMVTLLPHRRKELSEMILGGMVGGTIACFLTGCFAGLLYEGS